MRFQALELSLGVVRLLRDIVPSIQQRNGRLAAHIRDAASSACLNLSEGNRRLGRDRIHLWSIASGSAEEVRTSLFVAQAWGYVGDEAVEETLETIDHLQAILWKLLH